MEHGSKVCQECNDGDREGGNEMKNSMIIFIFTCVITCAQLEEFPKRDKKLLKFKKDIDKIAEDLENFAFDIAKEIVEKSDLFMITDYDYADYSSEEYSTEKTFTTEAREHNQANKIVKETVGSKKNSTKLQKPSKTRRKRSLDTALSQNNHEQCYQKPPAEQHLEKIHIEDLKEEVKHLYELINILRGEQGIFFALDREKDDDLAPRINSKDLLRTLEELNNEDPHKEFSTHKELAKIKSDLRRAITALDSTKTVLVQERRKELALEAELQRQQLQLQMLMENRTKPENDSFVGAALHLPKALPEQKVEAGVRARSNDLEDLVRLLDRIKQPKKMSRLQELLSRDPQPSKQDQNASSKLHQLIELLEQVQGRDDDEEVEDELQQLQNAIQKLKPKEDQEVLFAGREKPGDGTTAKLTQQQLVELRKKLDQMISSGGSGSGVATSNFGTGKISPPHPFWYANYRNFVPYFNYQGPTAYGYERGQYGPEQIPPYAGFDGSRYYPENNPYGNDFWTNRYRYTTDVNNRFFPANIHLPEDFNAGDSGQAGSHLPPDYRTKDIEELRNQIDALQNVIDTMNFQNYGKRPEDEATIANLEKQIKDLRGIVNGLNQEVAPNFNQHPPSNIQPLPSYNQPPPTYNQQPFIHETPNNLSQQPYEAHQVTKRSAVQESDTPLNYNQASPSYSQSPMSFNKPFPSNNFPPPSNNQDHQVIKKSTVPENNPALTQLLNGDFKSKNIAVENNPTSQKSNEIHNQPPPNYNKFPLNYNQPLSYSQPSLSYGQPPLNYNQPPLNYNQPPLNYNQPPPSFDQPLPKRSSTDSQLLDDVYSKLKSYLLDDKRSSNYDATEERISRLRAQ